MRTILAVRGLRVLFMIVVFFHLGASAYLLTDRVWSHLHWRSLSIPMPGGTIMLEMFPQKRSQVRVPAYVYADVLNSQQWSSPSSFPEIPDVILVTIWSRDTIDNKVRIFGVLTLSRRILAAPLLIVPCMWLVSTFIEWWRKHERKSAIHNKPH